MQGRKKELLLQAWVATDAKDPSVEESKWAGVRADAVAPPMGVASSAELTPLKREDGHTLWTGLGCNQTEFRLLLGHVTGNAKEANEVEITEFYVDLANETTRADLRHRWSAQRLVLKDKSLKKSMAADQSLVGDVKGYLTRMHEFQKEMMTHHELLDWLRTSWPNGSASASSEPAGADTRAHETEEVDRVAELSFAENRAINETGHVLPFKVPSLRQ